MRPFSQSLLTVLCLNLLLVITYSSPNQTVLYSDRLVVWFSHREKDKVRPSPPGTSLTSVCFYKIHIACIVITKKNDQRNRLSHMVFCPTTTLPSSQINYRSIINTLFHRLVRPLLSAYLTNSAVLFNRNFSIIRLRYASTVLPLMSIASAISLELLPLEN